MVVTGTLRQSVGFPGARPWLKYNGLQNPIRVLRCMVNSDSYVRVCVLIMNFYNHCVDFFISVNRSRPNQITGPGPKSGPAEKSESRGPENGVSRWRRPNSAIYSQNHHFRLVYDMIYQFLGMDAKNYKFWYVLPTMPSIRGLRWCRYSTEKCLPDSHPSFVYVVILSTSPIWRIGETNPSTKTSNILFSIVMPTFGKSCRRPSLHGLKNQS